MIDYKIIDNTIRGTQGRFDYYDWSYYVLEKLTKNIKKSTIEEDKTGIDCWIKGKSVQIKTKNHGQSTEIELDIFTQKDGHKTKASEHPNNIIVDYFVVVSKQGIFRCSKKQLVSYINTHLDEISIEIARNESKKHNTTVKKYVIRCDFSQFELLTSKNISELIEKTQLKCFETAKETNK